MFYFCFKTYKIVSGTYLPFRSKNQKSNNANFADFGYFCFIRGFNICDKYPKLDHKCCGRNRSKYDSKKKYAMCNIQGGNKVRNIIHYCAI